MSRHARPALGCCVLVLLLTLVGCHEGPSPDSSGPPPTGHTTTPDRSGGARATPTPTRRPTPTPTRRPAATPTQTAAERALRRLSLDEQVGQLLLVGIPASGTSGDVLPTLRSRHVGGIMLTGRSELGVEATRGVVEQAEAGILDRDGPAVPLIVATDQEGGAVQVLRGPGFDDMPEAVRQGEWAPGTLGARARRWGGQLRAAGVNLDLAPVGDIVPRSPDPRTNGPIGHFDRQFGPDAGVVRPHATAFACGMSAAGVATAVKHFPGLGHVRDNTDVSSRVVDDTIGPRDRGLSVFTDVADACRSLVMTSTAVYERLDPAHPASFSAAVVTTLLRERLGFEGVVVSDDLGSALQVQRWTPGDRARMFVAAGGDLVLTVDPGDVPQMCGALAAAARQDPAMAARVRQSALRVLTLKARLGLLDR